jgi:hypothetical protein
MSAKDTLSSKQSRQLIMCGLFLLATSLGPRSAAASVSVTATKDCLLSPCTVTEAQFTILTSQTIQWTASYTGTSTQGHSFYISDDPTDPTKIPLTTSAGASGSHLLAAGTYSISIRLATMGPGTYTITYNPSSSGDPHITTTNGMHYDFQGAGEFVLLRQPDGPEIQVRQTPLTTTIDPGPDPYDGLATCVSLNTAVAARVGEHRVTYEPNLSGVPDPSGLQLRVDGVLTTLGPSGLDLGRRGRITKTADPGGLRIDFPNGSGLFVTPGWWADQSRWYLNLDIIPSRAAAGIVGAIAADSWLPALPDGTSMGAMPSLLHDRYVGLYHKFADAWRVTDRSSLFDYAPGTSTDTFTTGNWPPEQPPCVIRGTQPVEPASEPFAKQACRGVVGESPYDNCVFDVMVTGNPGFAATYLLSQDLVARPSAAQGPNKLAGFLDFGAGIPSRTFSSSFNTGLSFNAGLEYPIASRVSAEGIFGYHRFPGSMGGHGNLGELSANAKVDLLPRPNRLRPFVDGGIGVYKLSPGSSSFGANLGGGVLYEATPRFGVQGLYNFRTVNTPGSATRFSTLQGGIWFVL